MKDTNLYFGYTTDNSEFIISRSEEKRYQNIVIIGENVLKSKKFVRQLFRDVKFADDIDIDYSIQNSILNNNFECRIKEIKDEMHKRYVLFSNCKVRNFYEYNEKKQKLIYILKYFIIEDLHKVLNDYNLKDFLDLISYGGGAGFRFVIYVSNADNEILNSFLFSFNQTKIIFRTDKDIIKKYLILLMKM